MCGESRTHGLGRETVEGRPSTATLSTKTYIYGNRERELAPTGRWTIGWEIVSGRLHLPEKKEEIGTQEQNVNDHQSTTRKSGFQPRKQIDRSNKHNQSLYRCNDTTIVIPVPIRNRAFKDKIGEREEVKYPTLKGWACRELSPTSQL